MNKIYRGFIRVIQQLNYSIYKHHYTNRENQLSKLSIDLERLSDEFVDEMSKGLRINKRFPAGKSFWVEVEGEELVVEVLFRFRRVLDNMDSKGTSGIDVYFQDENGEYCWKDTIAPSNNYQMCVKKSIQLLTGINRLKFYLPSFAIVEGIYFSSCILKCIDCKNTADIVVYGSSITHGCAASRPGLNYVNQISNMLGCTIANYGFSESAKGEEKLLNYISSIPSKVFIMEYDHNVSLDELKSTHRNAYMIVRNNFKGWIILMSRFSGGLSITSDEEKKRVSVIQNTYNYARDNGDTKILFYNGSQLLRDNKEAYLIDKVHPNDKGMSAIANMLCSLIKEGGMLI